MKEDILKQCTIDGLLVKLPDVQLERKLYSEVSKALELIGGKWNRKEQAFLFKEDPTELLKQIQTGEQKNLKKEFQFFATPDEIADELVRLSNFNKTDKILEPSAGQGSIIKAIRKLYIDADIEFCELMPLNASILLKMGEKVIGDDFLQLDKKEYYDIIIGNPPFSKNQDITHIYKMYECLKSGGRIVTIASKHWEFSKNKKETEFRNWLDGLDCSIDYIDAGAFKNSGTMISSCIIIIDKR